MDLKLLEKMRSSCPSRASFMDFINHTDSSATAMKGDARKADEISPMGTEIKLVKAPLGDITNIQASRDNSEKHDAVKENPAAFCDKITEIKPTKVPTEEQTDGFSSPSTVGEVSRMIEEPAPTIYRYESTSTHLSELPISEDANNEMTSVVSDRIELPPTKDTRHEITSVASDRIELNPEAPSFSQQQALETQPSGSPVFNITYQDLSDFIHEQTEGINEGSPTRQEAVEPRHLYYTYDVWNNETVPCCNKQTSSVAEGYPPNYHEAAEHQSANASASEDETDEFCPINDKAYALTQHEAAEKQSANFPYHEAVDFEHQPAYYDYLDTILEESESEHDEVIKAKFVQENAINSATSSPFKSSVASSNASATNEWGVIDSYISDTLENSTTIVDPDTPNTVASDHSSGEGKKRIIRFDPNGDLYLKVGTNHTRNMLVDSRALGRASSKLHAVISESAGDDTGEHWTIEFPDDDPKLVCHPSEPHSRTV
ncbi:hypothetical protein FPOAC2_01303 [Fusarium poae]|uniref:hypothetical protein n=1 Tax=Fusarium poae TaxID=36050 RepID=UPI001CE800D2|nr:hypothetical protein FPOAC1_001232 [Fusarium poae]KAG8675254.1 hypothetical protein FPOAC1_001232 [Fusarium poae]